MIKHTLVIALFLCLFACNKEKNSIPQPEKKFVVVSNGKTALHYDKGSEHIIYTSESGKQGDFVLENEGKDHFLRGTKTKSITEQINFEFNNFDWEMSFSSFVQNAPNKISYTVNYSDGGQQNYVLESEENMTIEDFQLALIGEHNLSDVLEGLSAIATPNQKCELLCGIVAIVATAVVAAVVTHCDNIVEAGVEGCSTGCFEAGACSVICKPCN